MKRLLILLTCVLCAHAAGSRTNAQEIEKTKVRSGDKDRVSYTFVPDKLDAASPVPLVILLHGSGRNGMSQAEKWRDLAKKERFVIAAPDSANSSGWQIPQDGPDYIRDVVEFMASKYPIDKRRVYLFGHSAGAIMALNLTLFESEYFAATVAHAGVLPKQLHSMISEAKRKVPISLIVGTNDNLFPVEAVRSTRKALTDGGFKVELAEITNHTHNYYAIAKDVNERAWAFLKEQKLSGDPVYETHRFK